ncbi:phage antirepressor KilAC domain-containing protein [Larkinella terrae]|uniref:Antirepressor protein C-terminal domain-containing protein n=1 Tax=Larkinella terrae TaxID=2025311 RepID=A0A7K0EJU0_9BACT|nr:phage antirepressor KilAC domain-containing protein [Larkinella terrae]MRS61791.1 hypothetical protein [Larkinella terrae]
MNTAIQKAENNMLVKFEDIEINVQEDKTHGWLMDTELVAKGYGVTPDAIRNRKSRKASELIEGKHFISVTNCYAVGNQTSTLWTKRGVIRLGFGMHGERAAKFRDWAEDLIIEKINTEMAPMSDDEILTRAVILANNKLLLLEAKIEQDRPKVEYVDVLLNTEDCVLTTVIATELGISATRLNRILEYLQIQYKRRDTWVLTVAYSNRGYTKMETQLFDKGNGVTGSAEQMVWTQRGRAFLRWMFYKKPEIRMMSKRQTTHNVYSPTEIDLENHSDESKHQ